MNIIQAIDLLVLHTNEAICITKENFNGYIFKSQGVIYKGSDKEEVDDVEFIPTIQDFLANNYEVVNEDKKTIKFYIVHSIDIAGFYYLMSINGIEIGFIQETTANIIMALQKPEVIDCRKFYSLPKGLLKGVIVPKEKINNY